MSDQETNRYESDNEDEGEYNFLITEQLKNNYYPLKNTWVLYDHIKSDSDTYKDSTRAICEFDDIVGFWQVFNNYPRPSKLFHTSSVRPILTEIDEENVRIKKEITSISIFKKGILPKWEDPINKKGAEFSKRRFNKHLALQELDDNWYELILACIGGVIDDSVTGIRVVDSSSNKNSDLRLLYRIEIWFDDIDKKDIIEEQFSELLDIEDPSILKYKEHDLENFLLKNKLGQI